MSATTVTAQDLVRPSGPRLRSRLGGFWRGPAQDPAWARPGLFAVLGVTGLLYLFNLSRNGYANDFYAAAVRAGTRSWKAAFFGSFDSSNFITVDKTPASLWVDEIVARIFGFSSWTLLVPQAVEGVLAVWLLYVAVKRWFGPSAGLIAGAAFALTPAAALIFRFNNPDALLTLLMVAAAYCVQRAVERDSRALRWLVFAGLLLGFAFLAKMLQAFLVLPGFALGYLVAARKPVFRRVGHVLAGGLAVIVGAGWWVAIAQLWPAGSRPYFGGSTNNNILELALGYNGLGRLDGTETGSIGFNGSSVGGGGGGANFGGSTGIFRLFQSEFGGQVSWLIPAALISLGALIWVSRPRKWAFAGLRRGGEAGLRPSGAVVASGSQASSPAGDAARRMRAFAAIWGGWLLVTGLVFSYMQGIIHPYYMVALGPAIGALVGVGATSLGQARLGWLGRVTTVVAVGVTAWWSYELLDRTPDWLPWLRWLVVAAGIVSILALLAGGLLRLGVARAQSSSTQRGAGLPGLPGRPGPGDGPRVVLLDGEEDRQAALAALDAAPAAELSVPEAPAPRRTWAFGRGAAVAATAVAVGGALAAGLGGPLAYTLDTVNSTSTGSIPSAGPTVTGSFGGFGGGAPGRFAWRGTAGRGGIGGLGGRGTGTGGTGTGNFPGGSTGTGGTGPGTGGTGTFPRGNFGGTGGRGGAGGFGGGGGLSGNTDVSSALIKLLETDSGKYRWIAATEGSQEAAPIELATGGLAVVAIGGFNGSDPSPTLAQFESMVDKGEIHYYVGRGSNSFGGGSGSTSIANWVTAHYKAQTVGGTTVYDLTKPTS